jgi:uncharacterized protein
MVIIGYICAMLIGIALGALGSGGSIMTVPIMVYLMAVNPIAATGYSLFVVGMTSAIGGIKYIRRKLVDVKTATIFALPSLLSVFLTRNFIMPALPNPIISMTSFTLSKEMFIMVLFAVLMIAVSVSMIRQSNYPEPEERDFYHYNYPMLIYIGFLTGFITGIVGVGGGFIIIPALVFFAKIPVRMCVGTSLLIIAANSFIGFIGETLAKHESIDYKFLIIFSVFSVTGIFIGFSLASKVTSNQLKKMFGWFVLVMGIAVFVKEIFFR